MKYNYRKEYEDIKSFVTSKESKKISNDATVSINPDTGKLIQTNPTSSKLAERLKRRGDNDKTK